MFGDPLKWDGNVQLYPDGRYEYQSLTRTPTYHFLRTYMQVYNYTTLTDKYCISRSYFLPPGVCVIIQQPFYF